MFVALAAALLLQQESAEELLKKLEKRYAEATTFKMSMEARRIGSIAGTPVDDTWMGKFASKGENQVYMHVWGSNKTTWVTDGKTMAITVDKKTTRKEHTLRLGAWARRGTIRAGLYSFINSLAGTVFKGKAVSFEGLFKFSAISDGGAEKVDGVDCRIIACTFVPPEPNGVPLKCRLWIDPKNLILMRRESVRRTTSDVLTITESFIAPVFDGEIKDDQFKIP
jgi:outer membrane lipoprotein-sorting protein